MMVGSYTAMVILTLHSHRPENLWKPEKCHKEGPDTQTLLAIALGAHRLPLSPIAFMEDADWSAFIHSLLSLLLWNLNYIITASLLKPALSKDADFSRQTISAHGLCHTFHCIFQTNCWRPRQSLKEQSSCRALVQHCKFLCNKFLCQQQSFGEYKFFSCNRWLSTGLQPRVTRA